MSGRSGRRAPYCDVDEQRGMAMGISSYTAFDKVFESLASAAKYLSPFYYQLVAELLVRKHRSDEVRRRSAKGGGAQSQRSAELCGAESSLEFNGRLKQA